MFRFRLSLRAWGIAGLLVILGSGVALRAEDAAATAIAPAASEPLAAQIDSLIAAKLPDYEKVAAPVAGDLEFLRRVYLDLTGSIPTSKQAREFLADASPEKRTRLIDQLLASPEFARQLARVLDVMLMQRRPPQNVPVADFKAILYTACLENRPWDQLVSEILSADGVDPQTRPASRFYLDRGGEVNLITADIGRIFMGVNLECAQCHNHPHVEEWKQSHYYGISAFLVRSSLFNEQGKQVFQENAVGEVSFESVFDIRDKISKGPQTTRPRVFDGMLLEEPKFDFGQEFARVAAKDVRPIPNFSRRAQLAEAVISPANRQFRRTIANRLWATLMGRGLVHPMEADHSENLASHPELLDLLAENIAARKYDMRGYLRDLLLSKTYQRSGVRTAEQQATPAPDDATFAVAILRPMMAEQLCWSLMQATGISEIYRIGQGANFTEAKLYEQLYGVEQTFANMFGGEAGKPSKGFEATVEQTLYLSNDVGLLRWLPPAGANLCTRLMALPPNDFKAMADELYLSCMTRLPTAEEVQEIAAYMANRTETRSEAYQELIWALITSAEFRFNH